MLEPCEGKPSCTVLRGEGGSNTADLLDSLVESKQKFIGQVMTSKSPARSIEDVDATALSYAEVKMLATGDVRIKEKMDLDIQVTKLKMLKSNHLAQKYEMEDRVHRYYPDKLKETQLYIDCLTADLPLLQAHPVKDEAFSMTVMGTVYTERKEAGQAIAAACRLMDDPEKDMDLGEFRGFPMQLNFNGAKFTVTMKQHLTYTAELSSDLTGNIARINNALEKIPQSLENHKQNLIRFQKELESAKEESARPFPQEEELAKKSARLSELNIQLDQEEKSGGNESEKENQKDGEKGEAETIELQTIESEKTAQTNFIPVSMAADKNERNSIKPTEPNTPKVPLIPPNSSQPKPAQAAGRTPEQTGAKPSILTQLKQFAPPPPVAAGKRHERSGR